MQTVRLISPHPALWQVVKNYAFFNHRIDNWHPGYVWELPALKDAALQIFLDEIPTLFNPGKGQTMDVSRFNIFGMVDNSFLNSHMPAFSTRLQVTFTPAGLYRLTGIPATEFTNRLTDTSLLWGDAARLLIEELEEQKTAESRGDVLDAFLLKKLNAVYRQRDIPEITAVTHKMLQFSTTPRVEMLARQCHKSVRQFERIFKEHTGVSPKRFYRVHRFAHVNLVKSCNPSYSWLTVAIVCGYHDLAHLAKDFEELGRSSMSRFASYAYKNNEVLPNQ